MQCIGTPQGSNIFGNSYFYHRNRKIFFLWGVQLHHIFYSVEGVACKTAGVQILTWIGHCNSMHTGRYVLVSLLPKLIAKCNHHGMMLFRFGNLACAAKGKNPNYGYSETCLTQSAWDWLPLALLNRWLH